MLFNVPEFPMEEAIKTEQSSERDGRSRCGYHLPGGTIYKPPFHRELATQLLPYYKLSEFPNTVWEHQEFSSTRGPIILPFLVLLPILSTLLWDYLDECQ